MRIFIAAVVLLMAGCTAGVDQPMEGPDELTWRILASGQYGQAANSTAPEDRRAPELMIARSQSQYEALWKRHIGEDELPPAAFDEESVIFLLTGPHPTGGYSIDPRDVDVAGDTLTIVAELEKPAPDRITSQAFTAPYAVIAVNDRNFGAVNWYRGGELVAAERLQPRE